MPHPEECSTFITSITYSTAEHQSMPLSHASVKAEKVLTEEQVAEKTPTGFAPLLRAEDNESSYSHSSITSKPGPQEYPELVKEYGERRRWEWSKEDNDYVVKGRGMSDLDSFVKSKD
jgi:hypothetical protein